MIFWTGWSRQRRGRFVLILAWATPAIQAGMRAIRVSPGKDCGPKAQTKWRKFGRSLILGSFLWLGPRMLWQNSAIFLPFWLQGRLCVDLWSPRNSATLPGQQTFPPRPTSEVGDASLGSVGLWGECHESSRIGAITGEDNKGSFGRMRGRVLFFPRTSLSTRVVQWTRVLGLYRKFPHPLKYCVWTRVINRCTRIWAEFTLSAVRVYMDVTLARDEVLVGVYFGPVFST